MHEKKKFVQKGMRRRFKDFSKGNFNDYVPNGGNPTRTRTDNIAVTEYKIAEGENVSESVEF